MGFFSYAAKALSLKKRSDNKIKKKNTFVLLLMCNWGKMKYSLG